MSVVIPVGMGELKVARSPETLAVYGIGSCVIVSLYDTKSKVGGIAHVMLPDSSGIDKERINPNKFADTAIPALYDAIKNEDGVFKANLHAKIVGGSEMFPPTEDYENNIGRDNAIAVKKALKKMGFPLVAEDVGGKRGRSIEFDLDSGLIRLSILGEEPRDL
ncbi:MAG TPA: chemotaxis protein CheD [Candidatus Riflebacteria bacterium]|jgi:chemotaxis protein CheD|nr:MAG: chemotaxis protein CheD [Candidatus Riflebacteria bacterium HGW-Riflebacteria-1]HAE41217.1 chemotaxis protein CheD [Candidatus Riflebacteria bacterium]